MPAEQSTESTSTTPESAAAESPHEFAESNSPQIEPETPAKPEVAAAPAETPAHPQPLIDAAREAGLSERTISKLDTDALYEVLVNQHRKLSEVASQSRRQRDEDDERPRRQAKPAADEYESEIAEIEQEVGGPSRMTSFQRKLVSELRDLKTREADRLRVEAERRGAEIFDAADEAIDSLAKSTDQNFSKEQKQTLFRAAGILDTDSSRAVKRKITEAGLTLFSGLTKKKTPPLPTNGAKKPTAEEFENGHVPPSSSRPSRLKGDRAAEAAVHDYFVQNGITRGSGRVELEGVPD